MLAMCPGRDGCEKVLNLGVVGIIQARMSSTRLPGKSLMLINGHPMLSHIIRRLKTSKVVNPIIVATTTRPEDMAILNLAKRERVVGFAGSENDVLDRFYQASVGVLVIVRITGDCPLVDWGLVDSAIDYFFVGGFDFVTTTGGYPDGFDVEVFSQVALVKAWTEAQEPDEREHVTLYFHRHPDEFKIGLLAPEVPFPKCKLSVDTMEDLRLIRRIYSELGEWASMTDVMGWMEVNGIGEV